ncbi:MAG TPA: SPFH domain-containing protein [Acidimicrobiales bacterium]|nr:SPFH domain-containing protein [Acidimicrobiales bacterium]
MTTMDSDRVMPVSTTQSTERLGMAFSGVGAIAVGLLSIAVAIYLFAQSEAATDAEGVYALGGIIFILISIAAFAGLFLVQPNQSIVITVLGKYKGTVRKPGFWWTNPISARKSLSLRVRTLDNDVLKVNDAAGNPVEIAAVINWQVVDTARASFDVEDYNKFVAIQAEASVRHVASEYPYDNYDDDGFSLRANADVVADTLTTELQQRLQVAGVAVLDTRLRRLAYATEIAPEMLRRQQAAAVVAARTLIVDGAVGMVEHALARLSERQIVELDEERKAAMVSNLMVVLCSDRGAQPVVNAGTLYQ